MLSRKSKWIVITIVSLAFAAWLSAQDQGGPPGPPPGVIPGPQAAVQQGPGDAGSPAAHRVDRHAFRFLARYLGLTEEQIESIEPLMEESREAVQAIREELAELEKAVKGAVHSDDPDPSTIGVLVLQIHNLREEIQAVRQALGDSIEALLGPEQLEKLRRAQRAARLQPLFPAMRFLGLLPADPPPADSAPSS